MFIATTFVETTTTSGGCNNAFSFYEIAVRKRNRKMTALLRIVVDTSMLTLSAESDERERKIKRRQQQKRNERERENFLFFSFFSFCFSFVLFLLFSFSRQVIDRVYFFNFVTPTHNKREGRFLLLSCRVVFFRLLIFLDFFCHVNDKKKKRKEKRESKKNTTLYREA